MQNKNIKIPLLSIIIPSFNRGVLIGKTIQSVLSQTYDNWELIIVDDGSSDNTKEVVLSFLKDERLKFVDRPKEREKGGNAARNYGFEISKGEYVKWLDSDDLLEPDCLEKQLEVISKDNADVVFCRSKFFSENLTTGKIELGNLWNQGFQKSGNILENFILGKLRFSNNDGLWKKNVLPDKPYSENLKNSQEYLMITMMLAKNIRVELIDEVLVLIRTHSNQMANKRDYSVYAKNQILARYLVLKELNKNNIKNKKLFFYLIKSIYYYILFQIKKCEFKYLSKNTWLATKSLFLFLK